MANKNPPAPSTPPDNTGKTYTRKAQDPRVVLFKQYYIDPKSHTFMNVLQSALRAGYSQEYSESLGYQSPKWFSEMMVDQDVTRAKMLFDAEKSLYTAVKYKDGDKDRENMRLKASIYVTERIGKELYASRTELTDKGGRRLFRNEDRDTHKIALGSLFKGVQSTEPAEK
jgi:hypothetical protein